MTKKKEVKSKDGSSALSLDEKMKLINGQLTKFNEESVFIANSKPMTRDVISSGSLVLDRALGVGGYPRGRIIELFGFESSGKSSICLHAIAESHKDPNAVCAFIDMEHALDMTWAVRLGVDPDRLYLSQPETAEDALELAETLVRSNSVDIIVIDSVSALVPRSELQGEMGQSNIGVQARLMSQALRKLTGAVQESKSILMFTNQIREKVGITFGSPYVTSGGNALKFYSTIRIESKRTQTIKKGTESVGSRTKVTVKKNKVAPPFKEAEFDIMYDPSMTSGISWSGELLDLGISDGHGEPIIEKRGAFYRYNGEQIGQGRENAKAFLEEHVDIALEIENKIRDMLGLPLREFSRSPYRPWHIDKLTGQVVFDEAQHRDITDDIEYYNGSDVGTEELVDD